MYADNMTESMRHAIEETERRRGIQQRYNEEHNITPQTIKKAVRDLIRISKKVEVASLQMEKDPESMSKKELEQVIQSVTKKMHAAAVELNFELAAQLRDQMVQLKQQLLEVDKN